MFLKDDITFAAEPFLTGFVDPFADSGSFDRFYNPPRQSNAGTATPGLFQFLWFNGSLLTRWFRPASRCPNIFFSVTRVQFRGDFGSSDCLLYSCCLLLSMSAFSSSLPVLELRRDSASPFPTSDLHAHTNTEKAGYGAPCKVHAFPGSLILVCNARLSTAEETVLNTVHHRTVPTLVPSLHGTLSLLHWRLGPLSARARSNGLCLRCPHSHPEPSRLFHSIVT